MYKAFDSPLAENGKLPGVDLSKATAVEPVQQNWLGAAAYSVKEAVQSHPLETGGLALMALVSLRCKTPILEEMAAGIGKTAAKSGSGVPIMRSARGLAEETAAVADSTFVSPWARAAAKDAGSVVAKDAGTVAKDAGVVGVKDGSAVPENFSILQFGRFAPKQLAPETTAIPSISVDGFRRGGLFTQEAFRIVPTQSADAFLYRTAKESTVQILGNKGVGSGFFVDDGLVATANHVVGGLKNRIHVQLANGETVSANVVAHEKSADWALLKLDPTSFRPLPLEFASAREVQSGRNAFLIGRPHGANVEVMTKGRIADMFEKTGLVRVGHTAESATGFSGAPLLLENGKVVGIHRWGAAGTQLTGDAIHIRHIRPALDYLRKVSTPNGINWHTTGELVTNGQRMPKIDMRGHRFEA